MEKTKSNKTKIIIIVIAVIIVLAALAIVLPLSLWKKSKSKTKNALNADKRILNYYPEYYMSKFYSIVDKNNSFQILEKLEVVCVDSVKSSFPLQNKWY